jgi:hypothetical protein
MTVPPHELLARIVGDVVQDAIYEVITILLARHTATCAGATPTPAIPTSSRPNTGNEPGSAANANNAGAHTSRRVINTANVCGQCTRRLL